MKVLVATTKTQGSIDGDYCWTVDGELVYVQGMDCANPRCGCARGFAGFASHRATTTAQVVDRPITAADLRLALIDTLDAGGWLAPLDGPDEVDQLVAGLLGLLEQITADLPDGTVVRRSGDFVWTLPPHTFSAPEV